jgi:hypothetical protein
MDGNAVNYSSGITGVAGKTNALGPVATYLGLCLIKPVTGINPITGIAMAIISSLADITASCITKGSQKEEDLNFRLGMTVFIPFTFAIAFGCPFPVAVTTTIILIATRILLSEYVFKESEN